MMEMIRDAVNTSSAFADTTFQRALKLAREEEGVSKFEEISQERLDEVYQSILGNVASYSFNIQSDKTGFTDAVSAFTVARSALPKEADNTRFSIDSSTATTSVISGGVHLDAIGSGAAPGLTIPIADAIPFALAMRKGSRFKTVFDGALQNTLREEVDLNPSYMKSMKENKMWEIAKGAVERGLQDYYNKEDGTFTESSTFGWGQGGGYTPGGEIKKEQDVTTGAGW